ncbi:MAG: TAXI family TRAP transporter solute-binding subunit [Cyanobacteria bacterium P01_A01_bin.80]
MKRKSFIQMLLASALLSSVIGSGCSNSSSSQKNVSDNGKSLILTTATTGGTYYPVGVAIATLISKNTIRHKLPQLIFY